MTSKISQDAAEAFLVGREFKRGDTAVKLFGSTVFLILNGSAIAERVIGRDYFDVLLISYSRTALNRLNALPGIQLSRRRGFLYRNGELVSPLEKYIRVVHHYIDFDELEKVLEA